MKSANQTYKLSENIKGCRGYKVLILKLKAMLVKRKCQVVMLQTKKKAEEGDLALSTIFDGLIT